MISSCPQGGEKWNKKPVQNRGAEMNYDKY